MPVQIWTTMALSGVIATAIDVVTQRMERIYEKKIKKPQKEGEECIEEEDDDASVTPPPHDWGRSARYGVVHMIWNAPLKFVRLTLLNYWVPGHPCFMVGLHKMLINEFVFSPVETVVMLGLLEATKGDTRTVWTKVKSDTVPVQLSKWAIHPWEQLLMFSTVKGVSKMIYFNLTTKFLVEMVVNHFANRETPWSIAAAVCGSQRHKRTKIDETAEAWHSVPTINHIAPDSPTSILLPTIPSSSPTPTHTDTPPSPSVDDCTEGLITQYQASLDKQQADDTPTSQPALVSQTNTTTTTTTTTTVNTEDKTPLKTAVAQQEPATPPVQPKTMEDLDEMGV